jgi:hypothetical protein
MVTGVGGGVLVSRGAYQHLLTPTAARAFLGFFDNFVSGGRGQTDARKFLRLKSIPVTSFIIKTLK